MAENTSLFRFDPIRTAAWLIMVVASVGILVAGTALLVPLAIAMFLWILVGALRLQWDRISPWALPRWLANLLSVLVILGAVYLTMAIVSSQGGALEAAIPVYQANFAALGASLSKSLNLGDSLSIEAVLSSLDLVSFLSTLGDAVAAVASDVFLIAIYLGFLLAEETSLISKTSNLYREEEKASRVAQLLTDVTASVRRYIGMKTAISLLTGIVSYLVLLAVGVDFAAVWGLLIFFLNFIPTIGSIIGVIFPALLALLQFDTLTPFLLVSVGLGTTQFVIGNLIEPAYMGKSLNLSPFMILLSLSFWGALWGIPGAFLSVPMMVITGMFCARIEGLRWIAVLLSADGKPAGAED